MEGIQFNTNRTGRQIWISYDKMFGIGLPILLEILSDIIKEEGMLKLINEEIEILFNNKEMYELILLGLVKDGPKFGYPIGKYAKIL